MEKKEKSEKKAEKLVTVTDIAERRFLDEAGEEKVEKTYLNKGKFVKREIVTS
jgi:hypothetical protein